MSEMIDTDGLEQGLIETFQRNLRHPPPYRRDEFSKVKVSNVTNVTQDSFSLFTELYRGLKTIILSGCDVDHLEFLRDFPELDTLCVSKSNVRSLEVLRGMENIDRVDLNSCLVEDLEPLLTLPKLSMISIYGCPLTPKSFYEILPKLRDEPGAKRFPDFKGARKRPPLLYVMSEELWKCNRALHDKGIELCYVSSRGEDPNYFLAGAGMKYFDVPQSSLKLIPPERLYAALEDPDVTVDTLVEASLQYRRELAGQ